MSPLERHQRRQRAGEVDEHARVLLLDRRARASSFCSISASAGRRRARAAPAPDRIGKVAGEHPRTLGHAAMGNRRAGRPGPALGLHGAASAACAMPNASAMLRSDSVVSSTRVRNSSRLASSARIAASPCATRACRHARAAAPGGGGAAPLTPAPKLRPDPRCRKIHPWFVLPHPPAGRRSTLQNKTPAPLVRARGSSQSCGIGQARHPGRRRAASAAHLSDSSGTLQDHRTAVKENFPNYPVDTTGYYS